MTHFPEAKHRLEVADLPEEVTDLGRSTPDLTAPDPAGPAAGRPRVEAGRRDDLKWWRVDGDRVEMFPTADGWDARVRRADWGGLALDLDGHFSGEAEALAWCRRMAEVLERDAGDGDDAGREGAKGRRERSNPA